MPTEPVPPWPPSRPVVCLRAARVEELTALAARAGFTARGVGV
ncbi:hypothetical protein [Streptomyces sp. NPDC002746]